MPGIPQVSYVRFALSWSLAACLAGGIPASALAQAPPPDIEADADLVQTYDPPAHVSVVDGGAWLLRDGETDVLGENEPLVEGDRVRTDRGRVEIRFDDGSVLALDEDTTVDVLAPAFFRLAAGRVAVNLDRRVATNAYRLDAAGSTVWFRGAGEYRVAADPSGPYAGARVTVIRGLLDLSAPAGRTTVRAGYEARLGNGGATLAMIAVPVSRWDAFDQWVDAQASARDVTASAAHLPVELRSYSGVLDQYGDWRYEGSYGYVWYPRVAVDWYPYSAGRWISVSSYGWTWVGADRWGWPTHHYGRWSSVGTRWCWIPGRAWAPAWVSWATAPGYIAWSPLGYGSGRAFVNVGVSSSGRGWTVVSASAFSTRRFATVEHRLPPARLATGLTVRAAAPPRPAVRAGVAGNPPRVGLGAVAQPRYPGVGQAPRQSPAPPAAPASRWSSQTPSARSNTAPPPRPYRPEPATPSANEAGRLRRAPAPSAPSGGVVRRGPVERPVAAPAAPAARPRGAAPEPAAPVPSPERTSEPRRPAGMSLPMGRRPESTPNRQPAPPSAGRPSGVDAPRPRERGSAAGPPASGRAVPRTGPSSAPDRGSRRGR